MKIILAGGTGFLGRALLDRLLEAGHMVVLLTRSPGHVRAIAKAKLRIVKWDGKDTGDWVSEMEGADAVINLAGEPISDKRWTDAQKNRIVQSRLEATRSLVAAIAKSSKRPSVLVNASAVGFYGPVESGDIVERHPRGQGFLSETCDLWEKEAYNAQSSGVRVVTLRFGVVLEKDGGALSKMILPFRLFIGGPLGSGRQWFPWVHREDAVQVILYALRESNLKGAVNVTSPRPVTNEQFCKTLGKVLGRPSWIRVPSFLLSSIVGEMSEMLLTGQKALPNKLESFGYEFVYSDLEDALRAIFS